MFPNKNVVLLAIFLLSACDGGSQKAQDAERKIVPVNIAPEELPLVNSSAQDENLESIYRLINFYSLAAADLSEEDRRRNALYWRRKAFDMGRDDVSLDVLLSARAKELSCDEVFRYLKGAIREYKDPIIRFSDNYYKICFKKDEISPSLKFGAD